MVGAVGDDSFGAALLAGLDRANVDRTNVAVLSGIGSGMSVAIFDDDRDYGAVIVSGTNLAITPAQAVAELLSRGKVLVLQNEIPEIVNEAVARHARDLGVTTILNAAPARPFTTSLPDLVDILIVNAIEAEMLGGGHVSSLETAACAAERLAARIQVGSRDGGRRRGSRFRPVRPLNETAGREGCRRKHSQRRRRLRRNARGANGGRRSF